MEKNESFDCLTRFLVIMKLSGLFVPGEFLDGANENASLKNDTTSMMAKENPLVFTASESCHFTNSFSI